MARRYDTKEIRDTIGALDAAKLPVKEILRRLKAGEAGLKCGSISISERQVYNYRLQYREEHGPPENPSDDDTLHSIAALEQRMVKLLAREVATMERKRAGKLTAVDSRTLDAHHKALVSMQRRAATAPRSKSPTSNGNGSGPAEESPLQRLAREQQEEAA
jgi:hypothetical protein